MSFIIVHKVTNQARNFSVYSSGLEDLNLLTFIVGDSTDPHLFNLLLPS